MLDRYMLVRPFQPSYFSAQSLDLKKIIVNKLRNQEESKENQISFRGKKIELFWKQALEKSTSQWVYNWVVRPEKAH